MKSIKDADFKNKTVILRVGFDVPLNSKGEILDNNRIKISLPTIKFLLNSGAQKIILVTHLGRPVVRPKEQISRIIEGNKNLSTSHLIPELINWLKIENKNFELIWDEKYPLPYYQLMPKLLLLENIRFLEGEIKNDQILAKKLADLGEIFVNDAFSVSHRAHASIKGIAELLPSYAGLSLFQEIKYLKKLMSGPKHPFIIILGGAKISDKILVIKNLVKKADFFLLGGVMANTFLATRNVNLKNSIVEKDRLEIAEDLINKSVKKMVLPVDLVWQRDKVVDIGKVTVGQFARYIQKAKMIFMNGTMGLTSMGIDKYSFGTYEIIRLIADNKKAIKIISGGDTVAEVNKLKLADKFTFISTGGGATLEFLAGNKLPGLEALE